MSLQYDISFLKRLNLENFKQIEKNKFNFRCPICGDSQKSRFKSRGYAIPHKVKDTLFIYCHNCEHKNSFYYFLKELKKREIIDDIILNSYYFQEQIKNDEDEIITIDETVKLIKENKYLINVNKFKEDSIVKQYLCQRKIDKSFFEEIYFSINFKELINCYYIQNKYRSKNDIPRIVFPIINYDIDKLIGFQGRSIYTNDNCFRYLNVKFSENDDFIFEQKDIDKREIVFVTEGIFDCLMLNNSISMLGSNLSEEILNKYGKLIFVFDNEKRNREIVNKYRKIINRENIGLFIWPKNINYKDINDWALNEEKEKIQEIILKNSYFKTLEKSLHFSNWI